LLTPFLKKEPPPFVPTVSTVSAVVKAWAVVVVALVVMVAVAVMVNIVSAVPVVNVWSKHPPFHLTLPHAGST
jgi:hypothetical protein